jgi:hypothetical protein
VLGDETYYRIVNTRTARAACDALAEAVGQEFLELPIAVLDLDTGTGTGTSIGFRVSILLVLPPTPASSAGERPGDTTCGMNQLSVTQSGDTGSASTPA